MANLMLPPQLQFIDQNGAPLAGGFLYTYVPGTFTLKDTWQDAMEVTANTNPIVLDDRGCCVVYGDGDYRFILTDSLSVQIFDLLSSEPLPRSAISDAMLPVVGAPTTAQAMQLLGVNALLDAAIGAINLITGPTGASGSSVTGPTGPTGPTGSAGSNTQQLANPGYIIFGSFGTSLMMNWGFNSSDSSGNATVSFARPFSTTCFGVVGTCVAPEGIWVNPTVTGSGGFSAVTMTPYAPGSTFFGPIGFFWIALGY